MEAVLWFWGGGAAAIGIVAAVSELWYRRIDG